MDSIIANPFGAVMIYGLYVLVIYFVTVMVIGLCLICYVTFKTYRRQVALKKFFQRGHK